MKAQQVSTKESTLSSAVLAECAAYRRAVNTRGMKLW